MMALGDRCLENARDVSLTLTYGEMQLTLGGRSVEYQVIILCLSVFGQFRLVILGSSERQVVPSAYMVSSIPTKTDAKDTPSNDAQKLEYSLFVIPDSKTTNTLSPVDERANTCTARPTTASNMDLGNNMIRMRCLLLAAFCVYSTLCIYGSSIQV
jgi:hypothetical protein